MIALSALMLLVIFIQSARLHMLEDDPNDCFVGTLALLGLAVCIVYMLWNHTI